MGTAIAVTVLLALCYIPLRTIYAWRRNLALARQSGLPYILTPIYVFDQRWILLSNVFLPLMRATIPCRWQTLWLDLLHPEWAWLQQYIPFQVGPSTMGTDTFLMVSPYKISLVTAEPSVISQITARKNDFVKPVEMYKGIDIYGKNVVTTEGSIWRRHRKSTVPPFGEKSNRIVWTESIYQAQEMLVHWQQLAPPNNTTTESSVKPKSWSTVLSELSHDTMRLSLYVISRAGFGVRCDWPGRPSSQSQDRFKATDIAPGHKLSYIDSLESLLLRIIALFVLPPWLLAIAPVRYLRLASLSFNEWGKYMDDIYEAKKEDIEQSKHSTTDGLDLMGAMIRTSGQIPGTVNFGKQGVGMSKDEIIGNSFILFLAGHETAANTIHFCLLFLAMRPSVQRKLQADLDRILDQKDPSEWTYDEDLPKLFSGMTGAVMNEELRLIPPITAIPKCTTEKPQIIKVGDRDCTIPPNSTVALIATAVHRNPKHWPHEKMDNRNGNDLDMFNPERWLYKDKVADSNSTSEAFSTQSPDGLGVDTSPDTAETLFRPARGAYIPFSDGPRACLGRRFAQIEILAALAVIFKTFSVELSVDQWEPSEQVHNMDHVARKDIWSKARAELQRKLRQEMGSIITIQLRGEPVRVRICHRGQELFDFSDED